MLVSLLLGCPASDPPPHRPLGDDDDDTHSGATTPPPTDTPSTTDTGTAVPCPAVTGLTEAQGALLLERRFEVTLDGEADVWLACTSPDDPLERHLLETGAPAASHSLVLRGLLGETTYTCSAHAACGGPGVDVSFTTDRPTGLPILTATHTPGETQSGAYTLFNEQRGCGPSDPASLVIVDPDGKLRWSYEVGDHLVLDLDTQLVDPETVHVGGGWGTFDTNQGDRGVFRDVDLSGNVLLERTVPDFGLGFNHSSERLADGTYLTLTGDRDTNGRRTWNGVGVELWSPGAGVIWTWDSTALALAGEVLPPDPLDALLLPSPYHANAAAFLTDSEGDALWLSIYGYEEFWRIDRATGVRTHVFGAGGDFTLVDTAGNPLPDTEYTWVQHGPDFLPDGHVLVYDNGVTRPGGGTSRVVEYLLDLPARQATLLWSWTERGWSDTVVGDADYLPNGNVLVTQGFSRCAELLANDVSEIVELRPPDTVVARLTWPNPDWGVYRSQRYDGCAVFANARYCTTLADRWAELGAP